MSIMGIFGAEFKNLPLKKLSTMLYIGVYKKLCKIEVRKGYLIETELKMIQC